MPFTTAALAFMGVWVTMMVAMMVPALPLGSLGTVAHHAAMTA
jgi:hypothetical protein